MTTVHDFAPALPDGSTKSLADYDGEVLLIVNVASQCGLTPQYAGLQELQEQYAARGFSVLGFPCNQFGGQEPGTADEIKQFCEAGYGVDFPLFAKLEVNGADADPLYQFLRGETGGADIEWNFAKFLIARDGSIVKRIDPRTAPDAITGDVEAALAASA